MAQMTRVSVSTESLYGEAKTLAGWIEWLTGKFNEVPVEYRDVALLEIDSIGGYEGEYHTEAEVYYDRPRTPEEIERRRMEMLARADEAKRIAIRWNRDAERYLREAEQSSE